MRAFEHFPEDAKCPLCGTNKDKPCFLAGVDGTQKDDIEQAIPVHVECLTIDESTYRINKQHGVIYRVFDNHVSK
jgi:hypothetical protein